MGWKRSKVMAAAAVVLLLIGIAAVVRTSLKMRRGTVVTFLCESTGKTFTVRADPGNEDYVKNYIVSPGQPALCKIDGKMDAYLAEKDASGKWVKKKPEEFPEEMEETFIP